MSASLDWISGELDRLSALDLERSLKLSSGAEGPRLILDGKPVVQFASNDYLGLSRHPEIVAAAREALETFGAGAGASRLITGTLEPHAKLEENLADFKGSEAALSYATGSMANTGLLPALAGLGDVIFIDKLVHATIYDGARLSGAEIRRFPHQDLARLETLLEGVSGRKVIVVEAVYSMDGDIAPLPQLLALAEKHGATLVVDEAHSTGVLGSTGKGILEHYALPKHPNLILTGTLSKALGSLGGFVAGSRELIRWLINSSRSFIFATALPAASAAAANAALNVIRNEPERVRRLWSNREQLALGLKDRGWDTGASVTPILPLLLGAAPDALKVQQRLWDAGFYAPAIRPPTVSAAACRVRLTVSSEHESAQIQGLLQTLGKR